MSHDTNGTWTGVRCSLHRLQQPERGFAALADADIQRFS